MANIILFARASGWGGNKGGLHVLGQSVTKRTKRGVCDGKYQIVCKYREMVEWRLGERQGDAVRKGEEREMQMRWERDPSLGCMLELERNAARSDAGSNICRPNLGWLSHAPWVCAVRYVTRGIVNRPIKAFRHRYRMSHTVKIVLEIQSNVPNLTHFHTARSKYLKGLEFTLFRSPAALPEIVPTKLQSQAPFDPFLHVYALLEGPAVLLCGPANAIGPPSNTYRPEI